MAIRITLRIRESKVQNPDPPDWRRFVLSECISCYWLFNSAYGPQNFLTVLGICILGLSNTCFLGPHESPQKPSWLVQPFYTAYGCDQQTHTRQLIMLCQLQNITLEWAASMFCMQYSHEMNCMGAPRHLTTLNPALLFNIPRKLEIRRKKCKAYRQLRLSC